MGDDIRVRDMPVICAKYSTISYGKERMASGWAYTRLDVFSLSDEEVSYWYCDLTEAQVLPSVERKPSPVLSRFTNHSPRSAEYTRFAALAVGPPVACVQLIPSGLHISGFWDDTAAQTIKLLLHTIARAVAIVPMFGVAGAVQVWPFGDVSIKRKLLTVALAMNNPARTIRLSPRRDRSLRAECPLCTKPDSVCAGIRRSAPGRASEPNID